MNVRNILQIVPWLVACILTANCGFVSAQGLLAGRPLPPELSEEKDPATETDLLLKHLPSTMLQPAFQKPSSMLWRNGETVDGKLQRATGEHLIWKTALFSEALHVKNEAIARINFKTPAYRLPKAGYRVIMLDGSHLTGELTHLADDTLTLTSSVAGDLTIKLDQVVRIERLSGAGIAIPHAQALLTRNTDSNNQLPELWMLTAAGGLASPAFNQALETRHELPPAGALSLGFTTGQQIHFSLELTIDGMGKVTLETWGDELVLKSGSGFTTVRTFSEDERSFACQLCWNAPENRLELYSEGDKLVELTTEGTASSGSPASQPDTPGRQLLNAFSGLIIPGNRRPRRSEPSTLRLHNKGAGMVIDHFKITEWTGGSPPTPLAADVPYVETSTGILPGSVTRISDGQAHIQNEDNTAISMDTVRAVYWPRQAALERDPALTELWYADGQLIRGTLLDSETLTLHSVFSEDPLVVSQEGLRALILPGAEDSDAEQPALDDLDVLTMGNGSLHGLAKFQGDSLPLFFPVGSAHPVRLAESGNWNLARMSNKTSPEATSTDALAHLTSNESLPVMLSAIDRHQLEFTSDIFETKTLDVGYVHAVQFGMSDTGPVGFDGPGWRSLGRRSGQLKRDANGIDLPAHAAIGNAYACQGQDLSFTLERRSGNASIRVRLFTQGTDPKSGGISYLIAHYGRIYCGLESEDESGQMNVQTDVDVGQDAPVIRFRVKEDTVQIFVNDVPGPKAKLQDKRKGTGMIIESTSIWGNDVGTVQLTGFSTHGSIGVTGAVPFTEEAKDRALLLPRLRRDPPPEHLLIGRNGDLLRGDIEAMTSSHFAFRTGLESFNVPQDRLAAIVWLKPPSDGEDAPQTASPKAGKADEDTGSSRQWLDLVTGGRLALDVEAWHPEEVVGTHPLLGQCRIPANLVHRISLREPPLSYALASLSDWRLGHTKDPVLPEEEGTSSPMIGKPAPNFTLTTLEGDPVSLEKMKGKVVVLDFWATWCGPCVQSLPGLIETMSAFPQEKVAFLTVNQGEGQARIDQFLQARGLAMPVALDGDQSVGRKYGVESIPNTVIIDHEGTIIFVKIGISPKGDTQIADTVREAIESIEG